MAQQLQSNHYALENPWKILMAISSAISVAPKIHVQKVPDYRFMSVNGMSNLQSKNKQRPGREVGQLTFGSQDEQQPDMPLAPQQSLHATLLSATAAAANMPNMNRQPEGGNNHAVILDECCNVTLTDMCGRKANSQLSLCRTHQLGDACKECGAAQTCRW